MSKHGESFMLNPKLSSLQIILVSVQAPSEKGDLIWSKTILKAPSIVFFKT